MKQKILVAAAHPDDEVLGCGGAIIKHVQDGDDVFIALIGDGVTSRYYNGHKPDSRKRELIKYSREISQRKKSFLNTAKIMGVKKNNLFSFGLADQRLDEYPQLKICKLIDEVKNDVNPDIVYTHHWSDLNRDHRIVLESVLVSFRPFNNKKISRIFCFELLESTGLYPLAGPFKPDYFVDIENVIDKKIEAIKAYGTEQRDYPHPRSIEYLKQNSIKRGTQAGFKYAEAFERNKYAI